MRAQELANWLLTQTVVVGSVTKYKRGEIPMADVRTRNGIVFIKDGWGATDHIDIWYRGAMAGGEPLWLTKGKELWLWRLA